MSDALLTRIAVALETIAKNGGAAASDAPAPAAATRGRPPGSPNKPKTLEAAPTTAPAAEPDADKVPEATDVSAAVTATIKAGFREDALKILAKYGAKNASGVKPEDRAAAIQEMADITAAAG